jgi:hypothetical protein
MREISKKTSRSQNKASRVREFTPYTQRPIELWIRQSVFPKLPENTHFEIDETLGGNRAPLTARMSFLKRHLNPIPLIEVLPKLSVAILTAQLELDKRIISTYRQLEEGIHSREEILIQLSKKHDVFIYERDLRKLTQSLTAFDAFICAYTAFLADQDQCVKIPKGFPVASGWAQYPQL